MRRVLVVGVTKTDYLPANESPVMSFFFSHWCWTATTLSFGTTELFLTGEFITPKLKMLTSFHPRRFVFNKRSVGSTHSSHGNLSQASITSCDVLSGDEVDSPLHRPAKISERRSNSSTDIQGARSVINPNKDIYKTMNTYLLLQNEW